VTDKHGQTVVVPEVGMTLEYEKDAYEINNTYAKQIGFSNRKNDTKRWVDKSIFSKLIVCSSKDLEKLAHLKAVQGWVAMLVFSLVSQERGFG
jgi:hypothetical protein